MEDLSQQVMVVSHVQAQAQEGIAAKKLPYVIALPMVHFVFPPTFCISIVSNFFSLLQSPREIEDNAYAKSKGANRVYLTPSKGVVNSCENCSKIFLKDKNYN